MQDIYFEQETNECFSTQKIVCNYLETKVIDWNYSLRLCRNIGGVFYGNIHFEKKYLVIFVLL